MVRVANDQFSKETNCILVWGISRLHEWIEIVTIIGRELIKGCDPEFKLIISGDRGRTLYLEWTSMIRDRAHMRGYDRGETFHIVEWNSMTRPM